MTGGSWKSKTQLSLTAQNLLPNTTTPISQALSPTTQQTMPFGTGPGTASILVSGSYVLPPGGSLTLDLFGGSLLDMTGSATLFRLLRAYSIWIASGGDAAGVTIGNAGSNPHPLFFGSTSATKTIYPGGPEEAGGTGVGEGVAVTATARNVLLTNNSPTKTVTVVVNFAGTQCVPGVPMGLLLGLTYP